MAKSVKRIVGLEKPIVSNDFGVIAHFHVLCQYSVDFRGVVSSSATFAGYVSREAFDAGKKALMEHEVKVPSAPVGGDLENLPTWFAMQLLVVASGHDFVGATPIYADAVVPAEEAAA